MQAELLVASLVMCGGVWAGTAQIDNHLASVDRQSKLGLGLATDSIAQLAKDLLSRSTTSSQVLSLNLTNLVILLVVKALIFGAGSLGLGGGAADHLGRSVDGPQEGQGQFLAESDVMLMLSYMEGAVTDHYQCLYAAACHNPQKAKDYFTASNILVKGAAMINLSFQQDKYEEILQGVEEAVRFGSTSNKCSERYKCKHVGS